MGTQAVAKTPARREVTLVILPESGKYSSTDKPLEESVHHDVDQQLIDLNTFIRCFHDNMVIGLQCKYTTQEEKCGIQKARKIVHFLSK